MRLFDKILNRLLILTLFFTFIFNISANLTASAATPPDLNSQGVVLLDTDTGNVLYSKNPDTQFFPASTTKVLTALIVLENTKLDDIATVGKNPPFADGSAIGLREGEKYTIHDLLLGLLLESGNDCAETLAEHVSGSTEKFAELMNKRAKELGAKNSNFKNPSGLPDTEHVTTAYDLALIMREATKNKDFVDISRTVSKELPPSNLDGSIRHVNNHNYVLLKNSKYFYPYAVASKKGYTVAAKFTNVISASKDGHTLIASFLRGENINEVYSDVKKIFDYGFNNFQRTSIYSEGDEIGSITLKDDTVVPLIVGKDVYYTSEINSKNKINASIKYDDPTNLDKKSFNKGDLLTTAKVIVDGKEIETIDIVSGVNHEYTSKIAINNFLTANKLKIVLIISLVLLFLIYLRICNINRIKRKKRKDRLNQITKNKKVTK